MFVVLDGAPYLQASSVTDLAARTPPCFRDPTIVPVGAKPDREVLETASSVS